MDCHVGAISVQFNIRYSESIENMRIFSYTLGLINKHYAKIVTSRVIPYAVFIAI